MRKNLLVYSERCMQASQQGAQIIVFPEYGVYGLGWSRKTLAPYLEYIPDPKVTTWNPCLQPLLHNNTDIQYQLSCMAKNQKIYVVANIGAAQPCGIPDPNCPDDRHYQYSANVVYDSNGTFVARYFKQNLYQREASYFNTPTVIDYTIFNTTFGKFAIFSSNDIMFHQPAVTLIEKMNVKNIVYPTAWKDELPLLVAIELHSAFSMGMGINFLVANLHRPIDGYHGSGMYWPMGTSNDGVYYYNDSRTSTGKLLVHDIGTSSQARMDIQNCKGQRFNQMSMNKKHPKRMHVTVIPNTSDQEVETFRAEVNHDTYTFVTIRSSYGDTQACQGNLCCSTSYEGMNFESTLYALGAFDGMHTHDGTYYLQACIFIKCANDSVTSCGQPIKKSKSYMDKMSFGGNFTTQYVFPEVLVTDDNSLEIVTKMWLYQEAIIIDVGVPGGPLSISMYARDYSRDPS